MRVLSFVVIGIVLWGLSWLWPHVNGFLSPPIMIGIIAGLGAVALPDGSAAVTHLSPSYVV